MNLSIVSDLHISGTEDPLYASLLTLLRDRAQNGDFVVLAGDIFDLFVGDKPIFLERYGNFFRELEAAGKRGSILHYIEGNHDFQIGQAFGGIPGLTIHVDSFSLDLAGKRFFFAHGDKVDRGDYTYRLLRRFFRSSPMREFVKAAPGEWIDAIGRWSSRRSRGDRPRVLEELPVGRRDRLRRAFREFASSRIAQGFDFVVMGHCHDRDEAEIVLKERRGQYINVGYPRVHGSYLAWSPGDEKIRRQPF